MYTVCHCESLLRWRDHSTREIILRLAEADAEILAMKYRWY